MKFIELLVCVVAVKFNKHPTIYFKSENYAKILCVCLFWNMLHTIEHINCHNKLYREMHNYLNEFMAGMRHRCHSSLPAHKA